MTLSAPGAGEGRVGEMTAGRAVYFLERFKGDEKMLGPNEQWALDFAIAVLSGAGEDAEREEVSPAVQQAMDRFWARCAEVDAEREADLAWLCEKHRRAHNQGDHAKQRRLERIMQALSRTRQPTSQDAERDAGLVEALQAIAEGYGVSAHDDRYIKVDNPEWREDNGKDRFLVVDVKAL